MPFTIRPYRCFPVLYAVRYNADPFQGQGIVWNLSCNWDFERLGERCEVSSSQLSWLWPVRLSAVEV